MATACNIQWLEYALEVNQKNNVWTAFPSQVGTVAKKHNKWQAM